MRIQILAVCLLALAGCGGGDGDGDLPPPQSPGPPAAPLPPPPPPAIGAAGGTVTEPTGAAVVFPADAVGTATTFRIAMDSTGAPPVPSELTPAGGTFVVTPHGGDFAQPVQVKLPVPTVTLQPNQQFKIAKAEPGGAWTVLEDTRIVDGKLTTEVRSFSFFMTVIVTYQLPIVQFVPIEFTTTLTCGDQPCDALVGTATGTFTVVGNAGQFPASCTPWTMSIYSGLGTGNAYTDPPLVIPYSGGSITRTVPVPALSDRFYAFSLEMSCGGYRSTFGTGWNRLMHWSEGPRYPDLAVLRVPAQLDVVDGLPAQLDALMGGAIKRGPSLTAVAPNATDRAIIDWQRSDDGGASWRNIARSFQNEGNPLPYGSGRPWLPWSVRHGFIATAADQGALIRVYACYTPADTTVTPPPCVTGPATRLNVLQQSDLPRVVTAPRSVLIRTGETANFSVAASGAPAPTLQWQSRPANSTGEWTDVAVGTGPTTANYTTAPLLPSDNGQQFRVVATNAVGSAASAPVTASVSDIDVAPSITTQPASLSVATGGDAVFAIDALGTEAMSYQWRRNGTEIAGANSPILRLAGVTGANAGAYTVSVTNTAGNAVSAAGVLTVTSGTPAVVAPTIVTQPGTISAPAGTTATFAVGVDGTGPLSFQWRRAGVDIVGANSAVLTFNSVALPNAGEYSVVVSNSAGSVTSNNATLDVTTPGGGVAPGITSQPATLIVPAGGSGILAVGATGTGPLAYQWTFNGTAIPGATLPVLSLTNVNNGNVGAYAVAVSNSMGSVNSQSVNLILLGAPVVTQQPASTTAIEGNTATFTVTASGSDLRYTWMVNGAPIGGANAATYTTPTLVGANSGAIYSVIVHNGAGLVLSQGATLTVQTIVAPTIVIQPQNATIASGEAAQLCVTMGGTPTFDLELQRWNGAAWVSFLSVVVQDHGNVCYYTPALILADSGAQFRYLAGNPAGTVASNTVTVTVEAATGLTDTTLVSRSTSNGLPDFSSFEPSLSADGNLIAFISHGNNVHPDAPPVFCNCYSNAYVRNMTTGVTRLINYNVDGDASLQGVFDLKLSSNGRYAVFSSAASDLVAGDTNGNTDIFRRDLETGTTIRVSVLPNGDQLPNGTLGTSDVHLDISADGRVVTFRTAFDLTTGAALDSYYLYYVDLQSGFRGSIAGSPLYNVAYSALSDDGESVAYVYAIPGSVQMAVRLYDIEAGTDSSLITWQQQNGDGLGEGMDISRDGRYTTFAIRSTVRTGSSEIQVIVVDRNNGTHRTASSSLGVAGNGASGWPKISGDGRYVAFSTIARSLTNNLATSSRSYTVVGDVVNGTVTLASLRNGDQMPVSTGTYVVDRQALSEDGTTLAFVPDDSGTGMGVAGLQVYARPRP